jgi:hypothetical protein
MNLLKGNVCILKRTMTKLQPISQTERDKDQDGLAYRPKKIPVDLRMAIKTTKQKKKFILNPIIRLTSNTLVDRVNQVHKKIQQEFTRERAQLFGAWKGDIHGGEVQPQ